MLRILVNLIHMKLWGIHPSEVLYPCRRRTPTGALASLCVWFVMALSKYFESGSKFGMRHFLREMVDWNLMNLGLHILMLISSNQSTSRGYILLRVKQDLDEEPLWRYTLYHNFRVMK